jgi:molybdate transport repressor ModE-like protein
MACDPWFGVELRHLTALAAVAREGSFRGAADRLGYVQSAVSQQVANLEKLVGVRLVERCRGSKEVGLTEAGKLLVGHADEILARLNAARADLAAHADSGGARTLRVGVIECVIRGLLPDVLRRLATVAPELRVVPVEANGLSLSEQVELGKIDLAFSELPLAVGPFEGCNVLTDPQALLVPVGWELARLDEPPTLEELARLPLIAIEGWQYRTGLDAWCASQGVNLDYKLTAENQATARAFVAAGLGAAIVPRLGLDRHDERTAFIDLEGVLPSRPVALYWHNGRQHHPTLGTFRDAIEAVALKLRDRAPRAPALAAA